MNIEDLRRLDPAAQRRYIEVEKRFTSDTWKWVKFWAQEQIADAERRAAYAETADMHKLNQGYILGLQTLLGQEQLAFQEFDLLVDELPEEASHAGDLLV